MPGIRSRIRPGRAHRDRGAAAVEFALVMAPLIMLLLGLTTAGLAYNDSISMTNAVREGARFGATTKLDLSTWGSTVQSRTAELAFGNLTAAQVCVTLTKVGDATPVAQSGCTLSGTAPADPAGAEAGTCLVKVWAQRPSVISIGFATWDLVLDRRAVSTYERAC